MFFILKQCPGHGTVFNLMNWLVFALMTVVSWGVYGIFLHTGQMSMGDPANGRYKAFLFVGIAYFLTAVLAPLAVLFMRGANWQYPAAGMGWSLIAGIAGAIGAFCVLLAFGAKGTPSVVMSIVFAGAPIVNTVVAMSVHPPEGGIKSLPVPFLLGCVLAATGAFMVAKYAPSSTGATPPPAAATQSTPVAPTAK